MHVNRQKNWFPRDIAATLYEPPCFISKNFNPPDALCNPLFSPGRTSIVIDYRIQQEKDDSDTSD